MDYGFLHTEDDEDDELLNPSSTFHQNMTVTISSNRSRIVTFNPKPTTTPFISIEELPSSNPNLQRDFTVTIFGNRVSTTVTRRARVVREWVSRIRRTNQHRINNQTLVVGLGVQWRPTFSKAATLQLCVGSQCLIFQICRANAIPWSLRELLCDWGATFVGVRNYRDSEMLYRDYKLKVKRIMELGFVAGERGVSMERLAKVILGFDGVKKIQQVAMSEWDRRELMKEQVEYACVDAFVSFEIGKKLKAWKYVG